MSVDNSLRNLDGKVGKGVLARKGCRGTNWVRLRPVWCFLERGEDMQRREEEGETSSINTCCGPRWGGRAPAVCGGLFPEEWVWRAAAEEVAWWPSGLS